MFKTAFLATALTAFAAPALAQVTAADADQMEEGVEMMKEGAEMAEKGADMVEDATTTVADTAVLDTATGEVVTVTEDCPEGRTAQPDGTCMMAAGADLPE